MAPRSIRKALGAVKDQTSIGLAKVAGSSVPELEVAVVKATSHDEAPVDDKYVQELLYLTSYSRGYVNACLGLLARRLAKTRNWVVAIKTLIVTHRLLREADSTFEDELARMGRRMLSISGFTDESRSNAWDYSAFVRTYALYLDERLDCTVFGPGQGPKRGGGGYDGYNSRYGGGGYEYSDSYGDERRRDSSPQRQQQQQQQQSRVLKAKEMKPDMLLGKLPVMQRVLERVLACRPAGAARYHRLTQTAFYLILRESFLLYSEITDGIGVLLEAFFDMEYQESAKAFEIYARSAKQGEELASLYGVCKQIGVGRSGDFPTVPKVAQDHLDTLEDSLRERARGTRQQQARPASPPPAESEPEDIDYNGIKALPAPEPVAEPSPPPPPPEPVQEKNTDLLNLEEKTTAAEEGDRLALALFSDSAAPKWEPFNEGQSTPNGVSSTSTTGWELALVTEASNLSKAPASASLGGGFDKLLLESMYDQGNVTQKSANSTLSNGSASSVAVPGKNYLALPAPSGSNAEDDPFSASLTVPPPAFVQMADMQQKQRLLVQEQQLWNQYHQNGMQGQFGYTGYYGNGYNNGYHQYGMTGYGNGYGYGYNY